MRLADFLSEALCALGIRHVFGVTGRGSLFLTDGIARNSKINFVPMLHEQSAGFAANAAAQGQKSWSACIVSSGVAATNLMTPMLNAWQDQVPTIFITGQNHSSSSTTNRNVGIRSFGEQESNIVSMTKGISKIALFVDKPDCFPDQFLALIEATKTERPGPVVIDIPLDIQSAQIRDLDKAALVLQRLDSLVFSRNSNYQQSEVDFPSQPETPSMLDAATTVVLLGPNYDELVGHSFLSRLKKSRNLVVLEQGANSRYSGPNLLGTVGFLACSPTANQALFEASKVLAIGSSFRNNLCLPNMSLINPDAEVWFVDFDQRDLSPHMIARKTNYICADSAVDEVLAGFLDYSNTEDGEAQRYRASLATEEAANPWVDLNYLAQNLSVLLPPNAIVVTDSGFCQLILSGQGVFGEGQVLIQPHSQGCMGVAVAAGVGCAMVFPDRPIVVITGDGSLLMNSQDMITMASIPHNVKLLVVENGLYAIINKRQRELFRGRTIGTNKADGLAAPNFLKLMDASGLRSRDERGKPISNIDGFRSFFFGVETMAMIISGNPEQDYSTCSVVRAGERRLETWTPWEENK